MALCKVSKSWACMNSLMLNLCIPHSLGMLETGMNLTYGCSSMFWPFSMLTMHTRTSTRETDEPVIPALRVAASIS